MNFQRKTILIGGRTVIQFNLFAGSQGMQTSNSSDS